MTTNQKENPQNHETDSSLDGNATLTGRTWIAIVTVVVILLGIGTVNYNMERPQARAPGSADPDQGADLKPYTTELHPRYTEPRDLRNGIAFPFGEPLDQFRKDHDGLGCFDYEGETGCEIKSPLITDCPSAGACTHVTYVFKDGQLTGFMAGYGRDEWKRMLAVSSKAFGSEGKETTSRLGSMTTRTITWEFTDGTALSFVNYSGADINDNSIGQPFSVRYGMASELNR